MNTRTLGRDGVNVSPLGLGCMGLSSKRDLSRIYAEDPDYLDVDA